MSFRRYKKKPDPSLAVTAVQLDLDTPGLDYEKWGDQQHAKKGDWLVNNGGEVYTVEEESFAKTYAEISPGRFVKVAPVFAQMLTQPQAVSTKEGTTNLNAGDFLVTNNEDGSDAYGMSADKFNSMYDLF